MAIEIRLLRAGDESVFDRVAEDVFDEPVERSRAKAYLGEPGHHMVVAITEGEVIGQCAAVVHRHPDTVTELYVDNVGVAPSYQRRGIARMMLDRMFALGKSLGCQEAWVGTEPGNVAARAFYQSRKEMGEPAEEFVMYVYRL